MLLPNLGQDTGVQERAQQGSCHGGRAGQECFLCRRKLKGLSLPEQGGFYRSSEVFSMEKVRPEVGQLLAMCDQ